MKTPVIQAMESRLRERKLRERKPKPPVVQPKDLQMRAAMREKNEDLTRRLAWAQSELEETKKSLALALERERLGKPEENARLRVDLYHLRGRVVRVSAQILRNLATMIDQEDDE